MIYFNSVGLLDSLGLFGVVFGLFCGFLDLGLLYWLLRVGIACDCCRCFGLLVAVVAVLFVCYLIVLWLLWFYRMVYVFVFVL